MDSGRTSGSSKPSWTETDGITGQAVPARAELVSMSRAEFEAHVRGEGNRHAMGVADGLVT
jgi:hypothetical protein